MAKFKDIKTGRKFYQCRAGDKVDKATGRKEVFVSVVYVIGINEETKMVLASINKNPAKWIDAGQYNKWKSENPDENKK